MNCNLPDFIKLNFVLFLMIYSSMNVYAQKTIDVQEVSVWKSAVKIDGQANDWTDALKASNKRTGLSYTLANDSKNLYLIVQSSDPANINKIMLGGISLTVNTDNKKKVKDAFSITYPVFNRESGGFGGGAGGRGAGGGLGARPGQTGGQFGQAGQVSQRRRDSLQLVHHKARFKTSAKDIKVHGFTDIKDSLISVFNEFGIKALADFDEQGVYTCEFAIPLELIGLSVNNSVEFSYNIKVNGLQLRSPAIPTGGGGGRGGATGGAGRGGAGAGRGSGGRGDSGGTPGSTGGRGSAESNNERQDIMNPTDFWGKYTLAKQ